MRSDNVYVCMYVYIYIYIYICTQVKGRYKEMNMWYQIFGNEFRNVCMCAYM